MEWPAFAELLLPPAAGGGSIGGAAVAVSLIIAAASWFVVVHPSRGRAANRETATTAKGRDDHRASGRVRGSGTMVEQQWGAPILAMAPMVGQSDYPFRTLCRRHGTTVCWSEMLMAGRFASDARCGSMSSLLLLDLLARRSSHGGVCVCVCVFARQATAPGPSAAACARTTTPSSYSSLPTRRAISWRPRWRPRPWVLTGWTSILAAPSAARASLHAATLTHGTLSAVCIASHGGEDV